LRGNGGICFNKAQTKRDHGHGWVYDCDVTFFGTMGWENIMAKKFFMDLSALTQEDFANMKVMAKEHKLDIDQVLNVYLHLYPGKIRIMGEMDEDGNITRDEITLEGVKEYKGQEAMDKIREEIRKNKERHKQ